METAIHYTLRLQKGQNFVWNVLSLVSEDSRTFKNRLCFRLLSAISCVWESGYFKGHCPQLCKKRLSRFCFPLFYEQDVRVHSHGVTETATAIAMKLFLIDIHVYNPFLCRIWCANPKERTRQLISWLSFCQKLHENERHWIEAGCASPALPWIHQ